MRIVGTIEARMGASRLPGKTMMEIWKGKPCIQIVVERFRKCGRLEDVYVATTDNPNDRAIVEWCEKNNVHCFRGSEENVLERVIDTALFSKADAIVQMGADSVYLDYPLIDELVGYYSDGDYDFVCNDMQATYPLGIYGHVVKVDALAGLRGKSDLSDDDISDVVRYIWERPEQYKILNVIAPKDKKYPQLRLTVDYPEDLELAGNIFSALNTDSFSVRDIIGLYKKTPEIFEKTLDLVQKSVPFKSEVDGYENIQGS